MRTVNVKLERFIARITGDVTPAPRKTSPPANDIIYFRDKSGRSNAADAQLIPRLAAGRKVLVVGDYLPGMPHGVTYVSPPEEGTELSYEMDPVMADHVRQLKVLNPVLWFTSPAYSDLIDSVDHSLVVYDCTRQISHESGEMSRVQEDYLLSFADIIFVWDSDAYVSKRAASSNVFRLQQPRQGKEWDSVVKTMNTIVGSAPSRASFWEEPTIGKRLFALG